MQKLQKLFDDDQKIVEEDDVKLIKNEIEKFINDNDANKGIID